MKELNSLLLIFLFTCTSLFARQEGRSIELFNFGWKFYPEDIENGADPLLNDTQWRTVDLPHDFLIEQPWLEPGTSEDANNNMAANTRSRLSGQGFKELTKGWYRKTFIPNPSLQGKRILLDFGGIMLVGDVWLNGKRIGGTDYGYLGFQIDITGHLKYDAENIIAVRASTQEPGNSRWYTGGGLFRDVNLIAKDPTFSFARHGIYITTPVITETKAIVAMQAEIENNSGNNRETELLISVFDPTGNKIAEQTTELLLKKEFPKREYSIGEIEVPAPLLWSCESPSLYTAEITIRDKENKIYDKLTERFGIRTIEYSPEFGFKLNGEKTLLKGVANHHDLGALGAAAYDRAIEKRFELLKSFGVNHIRCSHNPYSKRFMELADEYGILIVDELFDKWNKKYTGNRIPWMQLWPDAVPEFIKRSRNHPSVIMWSLGNELQMWWDNEYDDWGATPYKLQDVLVKRYDPTRPATVAMFPSRKEGIRWRDIENYRRVTEPPELSLVTEIASYNYTWPTFPEYAAKYPHLIFYQSEANVHEMGPNYFGMELDKVVGIAYWGAINYLGESNGWPEKGWNRGVFDMSLGARPQAYLMKSMFSETPLVYIGIFEEKESPDEIWNDVKVNIEPLVAHWNHREGSKLKLYTYTNTEEIELFINGKSVGIKKNEIHNPGNRNRIYWENINYKVGNITAVARNQGKEVARHTIETTGKAVALKIESDNSGWKADGLDLQHLHIYAVDQKDRRVYHAENQLTFDVQGDARLVAVDNGNISSNELHTANQRKLYQGAALAILRAGQTAGDITVTIRTEGMKPTKIKLKLFPAKAGIAREPEVSY